MHRRTRGDYAFDTVNYLVLLIVVFLCLYPFYYVLVQSFCKGSSSISGGSYFWPSKFTLENYKTFFSDPQWITGLGVSVARTVFGTALGMLFTSLIAYALSFKELAFRKVYLTLLIISMYFSGGIIPYYVLLRDLHLFNTFAVYIIPGALNVFFVIVGISFFQEIPGELFDAARVDGANDAIIFTRLVLPVSKPFLATVALFMGVDQWNAWFDSAFFVQNRNLKTLSFLMMELINKNQIKSVLAAGQVAGNSSSVTSFSLQSAAMIIAVLPIIFVYPFLQKYFVKGIMIGSVKG